METVSSNHVPNHVPHPTMDPTALIAGAIGAVVTPIVHTAVSDALKSHKVDAPDLSGVNEQLEALAEIGELLSNRVERLEAKEEARGPLSVVLSAPNRPEVTRETCHYQYPAIVALVNARIPTFFYGPKGSGKTTAVIHACEDLGMQYEVISLNKMTTKTDLVGHTIQHHVPAIMYRCMVDGKAMILDEFDAGSAAALNAINAAVANRKYLFTNGEMVDAHKDFCVFACGNTQGTGANSEYTGRDRLDAATLDRFFFFEVTHDWKLTLGLVAGYCKGGEIPDAVWNAFGESEKNREPFRLAEPSATITASFLKSVAKAGKKLESRKIIHYATPRAAMLGCAALQAGIPANLVLAGTIGRGLTDVQRAEVMEQPKKNTGKDNGI